jgi:indolepyruvate ferredoxin oxidoreductase beta subunit
MRSEVAPQPIKIAILAMGGEGGGVLADWIVDLAEHAGWIAQTTSVPGVAQRTGATIYYVELFDQRDGPPPVLALMPLPGDVDIVIASELMEAARAVQRGLVSPDRTLFIASTHRVYAIAERTAMGDGRADSAALLARAKQSAQRFIGFDMARVAEAGSSPIGAVLFGVLAAAAALPWPRSAFEEAVRRSGVGVEASLRALARGFEHAPEDPPPVALKAADPVVPRARDADVQALLDRIDGRYTGVVRALMLEGLRRLVDYQDPAYAALYLDRIERLQGLDPECRLGAEVARHLALWMSYEDTARVADLKTRDSRFTRVHGEMRVAERQLLSFSEFMHPRLQELADTLPAGLGRWLLRSAWARPLVERFTARGRIVRTSTLRGYLLLRAVAGARRWRRISLRFERENQRIEAWLADIEAASKHSLPLALEIVRCQRLVKGYGDTHERGWRHFETLQRVWRVRGAELSPLALRELVAAALADEHGAALQAALAHSGNDPPPAARAGR